MPRDVGLWDLPDAVLRKICEQFCPHCDGEDCLGSLALPDCFWGSELLGSLDALMMVNVRISRIAQQVRFHVFCGRRNSLSLLVRTLVESPALAEHVRVVRLGDQVFDGDARCVLRELASPHHVEKLKFFAFPEADVDLDFMSASGEKRLLAKFLNLPEIEDSFCWTSRTVDTAACTVRVSDFIAQARLNALLLVKLAKNITSIAIQSEWPLALFPETKPAKIKIKQASTIDPGCLSDVQELCLDSSNGNTHTLGRKPMVDVRKVAGLLARLPNLCTLRIRGGVGTLSVKQAELCRPNFANLATLDVSSTNKETLFDILACCMASNLKHFRFTIDNGNDGVSRAGNDMKGATIVELLEYCDLAASLETLHIDTSQSILYGERHAADIREAGYETIGTLRQLRALRHLSISADNIYFPSLYPRVLLRDQYTGDGNAGGRLVAFLPHDIVSLEITGTYAMHMEDVAQLAEACKNKGVTMKKEDTEGVNDNLEHNTGVQLRVGLPHLKRVTLRGGGLTYPVMNTPYPFPGSCDGEMDDGWEQLEWQAKNAGPLFNRDLANFFAEAGVDYVCDAPDFLFDQYAGSWDDERMPGPHETWTEFGR